MHATRDTIPILVANTASNPESLGCEEPIYPMTRAAPICNSHPRLTIAQPRAAREARLFQRRVESVNGFQGYAQNIGAYGRNCSPEKRDLGRVRRFLAAATAGTAAELRWAEVLCACGRPLQLANVASARQWPVLSPCPWGGAKPARRPPFQPSRGVEVMLSQASQPLLLCKRS